MRSLQLASAIAWPELKNFRKRRFPPASTIKILLTQSTDEIKTSEVDNYEEFLLAAKKSINTFSKTELLAFASLKRKPHFQNYIIKIE
jgi:hypothetical protein